MSNSKNNHFRNDWLSMLDSVEESLKYYYLAGASSERVIRKGYSKTPHSNDWLNGVSGMNKMRYRPSLNAENPAEQVNVLRGKGLVSDGGYRLILRFLSLKALLAERRAPAKTCELHADYSQLADQIMPTLARINQRVAARRQTQEINGEGGQRVPCQADDTVDVALRAAQKLRS